MQINKYRFVKDPEHLSTSDWYWCDMGSDNFVGACVSKVKEYFNITQESFDLIFYSEYQIGCGTVEIEGDNIYYKNEKVIVSVSLHNLISKHSENGTCAYFTVEEI